MSSLRNCIAVRILAAGSLLLLVGCTSTVPIGNRPPDLQEVAMVLDCPIGRLPNCERRTSGHYECYCFDKDLMRDILDPEKR